VVLSYEGVKVMNNRKTLTALLLAAAIMTATLTACGSAAQLAPQSSQAEETESVQPTEDNVTDLVFDGQNVLVDGEQASGDAVTAVYTSRDIIYCQDRDSY